MRLAESAGLILDPWQQFILDVMLGEREDGKWAAREVAYLVARQNGKGGVLDALALAALFLLPEKEILHSAHEFKTAKKAYRNLKALIQGAPHLLARVERRGSRVVGFRHSNEDTSITLNDDSVIRYMARSNNTGRGFSSQRLIVDEAQECSEETRQALLYIVSAQPNPQIVFCGTVPGPKNNGEVFTSLRDRGRAGGDSTLAWMEWTPEPDADPMSWDAVLWSNPGLPYRITEETVEAERNAATTDEAFDGYCRERCSIWLDDSDEERPPPKMPAEAWAMTATSETVDLEPGCSFAVDVDKDGKSAAISVGVGSLDRPYVETIEFRDGTGWVPPRLVELVQKWKPVAVGINAAGAAGALVGAIRVAFREADPSIDVDLLVEMNASEYKAACGAFFLDVVEERLVRRMDGPLDLAGSDATERTIGSEGGWAWDRNSATVPISPLTSATIARALLPTQSKATDSESDFIVI